MVESIKMTDPVADMLTRIRNGYLVRKKVVSIPYSKLKENIAKVMVKEGYLEKFEIDDAMELTLKYDGKKPAVTEIKRVSKQGLRVYQKAQKLTKVNAGGIRIISTSQGLMTDKQARKKNLGGEVIGEIW